jgi:uncharacterized membrane protein HdeD (DUF308 family)
MAKVTIGLGLILILLGLGAYFSATGPNPSKTALIPAFFGIPVLVLGVLALKENLRKHAMHAAAALGVLGFLGTASALLKLVTLASGGEVDRPRAVAIQAVMALLCAAFVALCVRSFVNARRRRTV